MQRFRPMLASTGDETLLDQDGYLFEPKLDGIRALLYFDQGSLTLVSRNDLDITRQYPEIESIDDLNADDCIIDGELVLYDHEGNPDFYSLIKRHHQKYPLQYVRPVTYTAFDVLMRNGEKLIHLPLEERKDILTEIVPPGRRSLETTVYTLSGIVLWEIMVARGQEGVMAKRLGSRYEPGRRSTVWQKIKSLNTADVVIIGFRSDQRPVSSLVVGAYNSNGELHGLGRVGTGYTSDTSQRLRELLDPVRTGESPAVTLPDDPGDVYWTKPMYVCEVRFLERGPGGGLRHPVFIRLRPDKDPSECRTETLTA